MYAGNIPIGRHFLFRRDSEDYHEPFFFNDRAQYRPNGSHPWKAMPLRQ